MDYLEWQKLFGKSTANAALLNQLAAVGIKQPPVIRKGRVTERIEIPGIVLIFTDESVFPTGENLGIGHGVLTGIVLLLENGKDPDYVGPVPYGIAVSDSQAKVRSLLGKPEKENVDLCWDQWTIDGLIVNVGYSDEFDSVEALTIMLPGSE